MSAGARTSRHGPDCDWSAGAPIMRVMTIPELVRRASVSMTDLQDLLEAAKASNPGERIQLRDSIAAHGARAIPAMTGWFEDARLGAFAVRVLARIAEEQVNRRTVLGAFASEARRARRTRRRGGHQSHCTAWRESHPTKATPTSRAVARASRRLAIGAAFPRRHARHLQARRRGDATTAARRNHGEGLLGELLPPWGSEPRRAGLRAPRSSSACWPLAAPAPVSGRLFG